MVYLTHHHHHHHQGVWLNYLKEIREEWYHAFMDTLVSIKQLLEYGKKTGIYVLTIKV